MSDRKLYRYYARLSGAVFQKIVLCCLGAYLGNAIDKKYNTAPYGMFTGFLIGVSIGLWTVIRAAERED